MISRAACLQWVVLICVLAINLAGQQRENPSAVSLSVDPAYPELRVGRAHKFSVEAQGLAGHRDSRVAAEGEVGSEHNRGGSLHRRQIGRLSHSRNCDCRWHCPKACDREDHRITAI